MGSAKALGAALIVIGILLGAGLLYAVHHSPAQFRVEVRLPEEGIPVSRPPEPSGHQIGAAALVRELTRGYETTEESTVHGADGRNYMLPPGTAVPGSCGLRMAPLLVAADVTLAFAAAGLAGWSPSARAARAAGLALLLAWTASLAGLVAIPCRPDLEAGGSAVLEIVEARPWPGGYYVVDGSLLGRQALLTDEIIDGLAAVLGLLIAAVFTLAGARVIRGQPKASPAPGGRPVGCRVGGVA